MDKQANYRKKIWQTKTLISHIKCLPILLRVSRNIEFIDERNKKEVFKGLIVRRFQRMWKTFINKFAPSDDFNRGEISFFRDDRKLRAILNTQGVFQYDTAAARAKKHLHLFLTDLNVMSALEIRLRRYHQRITSIQRKIKKIISNNQARYEIIHNAYKSELAKLQIKLIKQKKQKIEKKIREVKPEVVNFLIKRYLKFCYDQHSFNWLSWRKLINDLGLTTKETIIFRFQLACKKHQSVPLRDPNGKINDDPEAMGAQVTQLIPCLDPDVNHKDTEEMKSRFLVDSSQFTGSGDMEPLDFANNMPVNIDFYPSDEILKKLIMRSAQIKLVEKELWPGFSVI